MKIHHLLIALAIQLAVTSLGGLITHTLIKDGTAQQVLVFLGWGAVFIGLNFTVLFSVWFRFIKKKKIAPLVIAVVSKYAILSLVLISMNSITEPQKLGFAIGVILGPVSWILYAMIYKKVENVFLTKS